MTCQECELLLARDDSSQAYDELSQECDDHLARCAACREFAVELRANSEAMLSLAAEPMPALRRPQPVRWPTRLTWVAAAAMAAMIILSLILVKPHGTVVTTIETTEPIATTSPVIPPQAAPVRPHIPRRAPKKNVQPQILQVKMLTDDPDVVIYWQVAN
jgi:hypothetical protein